jgi:hypothetical protein
MLGGLWGVLLTIMDVDPPLILLPGMAADGRLFRHQRAALPCIRTPDWIEPRDREPLADYAHPSAKTREVRVFQIHGSADRTLPVRHTRPDVVVTGAGHLLPFTHPEAVNDFIRRRLTALRRARTGLKIR